jgi:ATP-dependent Lon protease
VVLPKRNEPDLDDVPESVRDELTVHLASEVRDVLDVALAPAPAAATTVAA